jgi:hypothetical protein
MSINWKELQKLDILVPREVTVPPRLITSHFELKSRMEITGMYTHNEPFQSVMLLRAKVYYNLLFML